MRPKVRERLLEIAYEFIEFVKIDFVVSDVVMTGSLANYNWSKYSDIDLHVMTDLSQFSETEKELYQELFTLKKTLFNDKYDIKIFGYDTELYIQNENEEHTSTGVYSVLFNEWINEPSKETVNVDKDLVKSKSEKWMREIDTILDNIKDESVETAKQVLKKIKDKIKKYRKSGLEEKGEFSIENLVFKVLRRNNYIQKIFDFENNFVDNKLSLKEATTTIGGNFQVDLENSPDNHSKRALGNWQSDNAWDMFAPVGTKVKSYTKGIVDKVKESGTNSGKIYGTQVTVKGKDGYPDIFYTHIKNVKLKSGDEVNLGDTIGEVSEWENHNDSTHVHVGLPYGKHIKDLIKNNGEIFQSHDESDPKIQKASKSNFLESLKKVAKSTEEFKNLKQKGQKIPYNSSVELIQTALQFLGFSLPKWGVDGLFGPETEKAVKTFQEKYSLSTTGVMKQEDLQTLYAALIIKDFDESDLTKIQRKSDFSQINVENDKSFYENILNNIGAPISEENLKFLYAWRQAEGGKAKNNPFNTTFKLSKDIDSSNYNSVGVKNYSKPEYGIEATIKTLLNGKYECIVDGLKNDIGSEKISRCSSLKTWGTGDLVAKVLNQSNINPPQIYTV